MRVSTFAEIENEFIARVNARVWCSVATVDTHNRPRSRVLHPIWEGSTGWILTHRHSHKSKHLAQNPYVSLSYAQDVMKPVFVDCKAEWVDDLQEKQRIWNWFKSTPEPLGYDPAHDFITPDNATCGLLKLIPWRIDLVSFPAPSFEDGTRVWYAPTLEAVAMPE
jgi:general stress protein 26